MRNVSTSLNDDLADALANYINDRPDAPVAPEVLHAALCEYLDRRGYVQCAQSLTNQPADPDAEAHAARERQQRTSDFHRAIEAYYHARFATPPVSPVILDALRSYLKTMGVSAPTNPTKPFSITPAEHGSGHTDTSIEHDRVLAQGHQ